MIALCLDDFISTSCSNWCWSSLSERQQKIEPWRLVFFPSEFSTKSARSSGPVRLRRCKLVHWIGSLDTETKNRDRKTRPTSALGKRQLQRRTVFTKKLDQRNHDKVVAGKKTRVTRTPPKRKETEPNSKCILWSLADIADGVRCSVYF